MTVHITKNTTCTVCGCVCDDIEVHVDGDSIVDVKVDCELGSAWFLHHNSQRRPPEALIDGREASLQDAIETAADYLVKADMPLVYGLSNLTCEAQRGAVLLAESVGAVIDSHTSSEHGPTAMAAQLGGKVTCTLGEVRNRADLVVYWGADPAERHPRHFSRYTIHHQGKFVPEGRTMVVVDVRETSSVQSADLFLQIRPGTDFEVLTAMRALVKGQTIDPDCLDETGVTLAQLKDLVDLMKQCRFGAIFFGTGLSMTRGRHMNSAQILMLAAELNAFTKFVAMPMRSYGNVTGAEMVLCWTTGYAFGVNLCRGYPRSNPGEFSTMDLLDRSDVDACLVLGNDPNAAVSQSVKETLARIPTIVLDLSVTELSRIAKVHITTAPVGVSSPGTVYRMDGVPLPLRPALKSPYPSDEEVIRRITQAVLPHQMV